MHSQQVPEEQRNAPLRGGAMHHKGHKGGVQLRNCTDRPGLESCFINWCIGTRHLAAFGWVHEPFWPTFRDLGLLINLHHLHHERCVKTMSFYLLSLICLCFTSCCLMFLVSTSENLTPWTSLGNVNVVNNSTASLLMAFQPYHVRLFHQEGHVWKYMALKMTCQFLIGASNAKLMNNRHKNSYKVWFS